MEGEKKSDSLLLVTSVQGFNLTFAQKKVNYFGQNNEKICDAMEPDSQGGAPFCQEYLITT